MFQRSIVLQQMRRPFFLALNLLILCYLLSPLLAHLPGTLGQPLSRAVMMAGLGATLILSVWASGTSPRLRRILVPLMAAVPLVGFGMGMGPDTTMGVMHVLVAPLVLITIALVLEYIFRAERVDADVIFASITAYFLIAVFWAFLYGAIDRLVGGGMAFQGEIQDIRDLFYLSMVTLTTLGYGDIRPVDDLARAVATVEAFTGQMFVAVLVARLVALQILHAREE